MTQNNY